MRFLEDLKRRNVFKVGLAYIIVGWLLLQISETLAPALRLPDWFHSGIAFLLILGFPVALVLAWAYELTPDGLRRESQAPGDDPANHTSSRHWNHIIIALLVLALAYFIWDSRLREQSEATQGATAYEPNQAQLDQADDAQWVESPVKSNSIAVLPFANLSDDEVQEYFSDGITEDIVTDLAKISGLFVVASFSSFKYKGLSMDVKKIAGELAVRYILEGSVRRMDKRVRVTTKLIDTNSGRNIWAERYDRENKDIFAIQHDIASKVARELAVVLTADEQELLYRRNTDNLEAYDTYLQARRLSGPVNDEHLRAKRRALSENVIDLDPDFAGGYSLLSVIYAQGVRLGNSPTPDEDIERAFSLAQRAVAKDDKFAPSYIALAGAYLMKHEHDEAVAAAQEAVRIQPSDAMAYSILGYALYWSGRGEEAISALKTANALNPKDPTRVWLGHAYFTAERYEEAIATIEPYYEFHAARGTSSLSFLAASYAATGQIENAREVMGVFLDERPGTRRSTYLNARLYKEPEDRNRFLSLLGEAGMPE